MLLSGMPCNREFVGLKRWKAIRESLPGRWHALTHFLGEVYRRYSADNLPLAAGAISFFTVLSIIPLLIFAVTIAPSYITLSKLESLALSVAGLHFALALKEQVLDIVNQRVALQSAAVVFGLWTGSQVFLILELAMNLVWRSAKKRSYWLRRGLALIMVMLTVLWLIAAIVLSNLLTVLSHLDIPLFGLPIQQIPWVVKFVISELLPTLLVTGNFAVIYSVLPTKRVPFRSVIPGALVAGILWACSLHLFGWYINFFDPFRAFYGSLYGLILLMFWFYYSAVIMLLGAEISATWHRRMVRAAARHGGVGKGSRVETIHA